MAQLSFDEESLTTEERYLLEAFATTMCVMMDSGERLPGEENCDACKEIAWKLTKIALQELYAGSEIIVDTDAATSPVKDDEGILFSKATLDEMFKDGPNLWER